MSDSTIREAEEDRVAHCERVDHSLVVRIPWDNDPTRRIENFHRASALIQSQIAEAQAEIRKSQGARYVVGEDVQFSRGRNWPQKGTITEVAFEGGKWQYHVAFEPSDGRAHLTLWLDEARLGPVPKKLAEAAVKKDSKRVVASTTATPSKKRKPKLSGILGELFSVEIKK